MAFDWGSLVQAGTQIVGQVVGMQAQKKAVRQAESLLRKQSRLQQGSAFPTLGSGYMSAPLSAGGFVPYGGVSFLPSMGFSTQTPGDPLNAVLQALGGTASALNDSGVLGGLAGQALNYAVGGSSSTACPAVFRQTQPRARITPIPEFTQIGPDGRAYTWLYAGRPKTWSRVNVKRRRCRPH